MIKPNHYELDVLRILMGEKPQTFDENEVGGTAFRAALEFCADFGWVTRGLNPKITEKGKEVYYEYT